MPLLDAAALAPSDVLVATVVVVGSGPAGLTVALDLARAGFDVLVLESGSTEASPATADLDDGDVVGQPLRFNGVEVGLDEVRMRALGGSSGHWSGICRPLDPTDLEPRPWFGGVGWPITHGDLDPWYRVAESTLGLAVDRWDPATWFDAFGTEALLPAGGALAPVTFQVSTVAFGDTYRADVEAADGPTVVLGLTLVDLGVGSSARTGELVAVRLDGARFTVRADVVVLAAGGIEVARLLLASTGLDAAGVANRSGLVGVGFMEHPHRWAGAAVVAVDPGQLGPHVLAAPPGGGPPTLVWVGFGPTVETQEAEAIGNGVALLWLGDRPGADPAGGPLLGPVGALLADERGTPATTATVTLRVEQHPVAASTLRLGSRRSVRHAPARARLAGGP